jgi:hypothetical protein
MTSSWGAIISEPHRYDSLSSNEFAGRPRFAGRIGKAIRSCLGASHHDMRIGWQSAMWSFAPSLLEDPYLLDRDSNRIGGLALHRHRHGHAADSIEVAG